MHSVDHYIARPIEFIDRVNSEGWRIKVYGMSAKSLPLPEGMVSQVLKKVLSHLPQPAVTKQRYGVGFLIIHQGTMRNWILLDWWEKEDIIHHKLFSSPLNRPSAVTAVADKSLIACVHELRVITFESEAWIKTVLDRDDNLDFEKYLILRFNSES